MVAPAFLLLLALPAGAWRGLGLPRRPCVQCCRPTWPPAAPGPGAHVSDGDAWVGLPRLRPTIDISILKGECPQRGGLPHPQPYRDTCAEGRGQGPGRALEGGGPRGDNGRVPAPRSPQPPPGWAEGVPGKGLWIEGLSPAPRGGEGVWVPSGGERGRVLGGPHPGGWTAGCTELEPQRSPPSKTSSDPSSGGCLTPLASHDRQHRPQNSQALRVWLLSLCPLEGGLAPL